jgi:tetratricopeptide (TPR) repeat protein
MEEDFNQQGFESDPDNLIERYESMIKNGDSFYFDVDDFEQIVDHYMFLNHTGKAINAVNYAFKIHPYAHSLQIKKAQVLLKNKNPQRAIAVLNDIELFESSNTEFHLTKGHAKLLMGKIDAARRDYSKALSYVVENDEKVDFLHLIAQNLQFSDHYSIAAEYIKEALRLSPDNLILLYDLAYTYDMMGETEKSLHTFKKYIDLEPFADHVWFYLGKIYKHEGNTTEAINAYEYAIAINQDFSEAIYEIARLYEMNNQFEKALMHYNEYLELEDESTETLIPKGKCQISLDKLNQAIKTFRKVLKIDAYNAEAHYLIAISFYKMGKLDDATFYSKRAIVMDDENHEYWALNGKINANLNKRKESINAYVIASKLKPRFLSYWIYLTDELIKDYQFFRAKDELTNALKYHDKSPALLFRMSAVVYKTENASKAAKYFRKGLTLKSSYHKEFFKIVPEAKKEKQIINLLKKHTNKE